MRSSTLNARRMTSIKAREPGDAARDAHFGRSAFVHHVSFLCVRVSRHSIPWMCPTRRDVILPLSRHHPSIMRTTKLQLELSMASKTQAQKVNVTFSSSE